MKQTRGQFYIVAAVIIVAVVIGLGIVVNQAIKQKTPETFTDLINQLDLESGKVVDYGVYNKEDLESLLENFVDIYGEYATNEDTNLFFIYGDKDLVDIVSYGYQDVGSISINLGGSSPSLQIIKTGKNILNDQPIVGETIEIMILDEKYTFDIPEGKNFFFVVQKELEGGKVIEKR